MRVGDQWGEMFGAWDLLQGEVVGWAHRNFGHATASQLFTGLIEELGEYDNAHTNDLRADALADQAIYVANLTHVVGLKMSDLVGDWPCHQSALTVLGGVAHVILKSEQGIRGVGAEQLRVGCLTGLRWWFAKTARFSWYLAPVKRSVMKSPLAEHGPVTEARCLLLLTQEVWEKVKQRDWKTNPATGT